MTDVAYRQEIRRKLIHLSTLWMPLLYWATDQIFMLWLLGILSLAMLGFEYARRHISPVQGWFAQHFASMLRAHEHGRFHMVGATYTILGGWLTIWLFAKPLALIALFIVVISDSAAALIGRRYGRHKLHTKSWEGTIAFVVSGMGCVAIVAHQFEGANYWIACTAGVITASCVELYAKTWKLDDNLVIPLAFGAAAHSVLFIVP